MDAMKRKQILYKLDMWSQRKRRHKQYRGMILLCDIFYMNQNARFTMEDVVKMYQEREGYGQARKIIYKLFEAELLKTGKPKRMNKRGVITEVPTFYAPDPERLLEAKIALRDELVKIANDEMDECTEAEVFERLVEFTEQHVNDEFCYLHVYPRGYSNLYAMSKTFRVTVSSQIKVTDMKVVNLDQFKLDNPEYSGYIAVVQYNKDKDYFSIIYEAMNNTSGYKLNKMVSEQLFVDRSLQFLFKGESVR